MPLTPKNIVSKILDLTKKMASDWKNDLYAMGLYENVRPIYDFHKDRTPVANTLVAFVILAYSNESDWIVVNHDRIKNKYDILKRLGVPEHTLKEDFWIDVMTGNDFTVNNIAKWFLEWQKDSRWSTFISKKNYYSENIQFVNTPLHLTRQVVLRGDKIDVDLSDEDILKAKKLKGQLLTEAQEQEQGAIALHKEMENDFRTLNAILKQEDLPEITDNKNISYESMVVKRSRRGA